MQTPPQGIPIALERRDDGRDVRGLDLKINAAAVWIVQRARVLVRRLLLLDHELTTVIGEEAEKRSLPIIFAGEAQHIRVEMEASCVLSDI